MERLRPYLDHGILELDNTAAERGMRAVALDRKNYLFVGSEAGGKATTIAYIFADRNGQTERRRTPCLARRHSLPHPRLQNHKG